MRPKQSLPIDSYLPQILAACRKSPFCILTAPPGSGKTTRVPYELMQSFKKIVVLVPRRIAALSSAQRIADENGLTVGREVGYQVRFENKTSAETRLIFMTEGVFIKKINETAFWQDLELVILDEFHERSSLIDIALGLCFERQVLNSKPQLLVMSATLNTDKLANFFGDSTHIEVADRPHPLEIIKSKKSQRLSCDQVFAAQIFETLKAALQKSQKDILVFLPGLSEIRFIERTLATKMNGLRIEILHGSIRLEDQRRILQPSSERRLILATNVAESSLTLPSVDCVIDSGLVKKSKTEAKIGFKALELARISLFSARQRAGRAARTGPGVCYQLWHESDEKSMSEQITPEVLTSDLLEESLILSAAGISPTQFSWLDRPKRSFTEALKQLQSWKLLDEELHLTDFGKKVQSCPLDIERAVLFSILGELGYGNDAAQLMAYLETTAFDKLNTPPDLEQLTLNENAERIYHQLKRLVPAKPKQDASFRDALIRVFLQSFPHKVAQKKERNSAVSSRGRGLDMAPYLVTPNTDYYILLNGREISAALSRCDFAIGLTAAEFERSAQQDVIAKTEVLFDSEKQRLYKVTQKKVGLFIITESAKSFLTPDEEKVYFPVFLKEHLMNILERYPEYLLIRNKLLFLEKKKSEISLQDEDFIFLQDLANLIYENIRDSAHSFSDLSSLDLKSLIEFSLPEPIKSIVLQLPNEYQLPRGKKIKIDYESEQAPKISAKIQEFFGVKNNPTLLNGKLRMTVELLAPNYRPAQLTSQLEKFWSTSYLEIRKELKARYPRHPWPEDPFAPVED